MIRHLLFFISEAFLSMRRSGLMMFIAVGTITVSLLVFGVFLLLSLNLNQVADSISTKLEIRVYLQPTMTRRDISQFQDTIKALPDVKSVVFVDKNEAWVAFQSQYHALNLSDMMDENPLPHSLRVMLKDNEELKKIATLLEGYNGFVSDVIYGGVIAQKVMAVTKVIRIGGLVVVGFLLLATLFIVVNTIRLTVINRHDEVTIMTLVGATNPFIRAPFVIEGLLMGVIGAGFSIVLLRFFYHTFCSRLQESLPYFPLVVDSALLNPIYGFIFFSGIILGVIGAYISISKALKGLN